MWLWHSLEFSNVTLDGVSFYGIIYDDVSRSQKCIKKGFQWPEEARACVLDMKEVLGHS